VDSPPTIRRAPASDQEVDSSVRISGASRAARRSALRALAVAALAACAVGVQAVPPDGEAPAAGSVQDRPGRGGGDVQVQSLLRYGESGRTVLDVYWRRERGVAPAPAVLVVHGGGWRFGDRRRMEGVSMALAQAGFVAFNVNYTLAAWWRPGFPAQLRELRAAVRWVRRNAVRFRVDPKRIGALGSSAGAHLAGLLAVAAHGPLDAGARIGAAVTWSAPFDLTRLDVPALAVAVDTLLGCSPGSCARRRAAASPSAHVSRDDSPMLIVNSQRELVPIEQAEEMAARLASASVAHTLWSMPGSDHARSYAAVALEPSIAFLRRRLR
jgi:acetyl esterase/lipase